MSTLLSANMSLPVPVVGLEAGPQYATDVNNCLGIIDTHNHAPGQGVQIDPNGLNINSDLTMGGNNLIAIRSLRLNEQPSAISGADDLSCLYDVTGDLYFNDGLGNQIRITQSGSVVGAAGTITGMGGTNASATYVDLTKTFIWESDVNTPANMDCASIVLRKLVANGAGITLSPPVAIASDYSITLPALPASQKFMTLDNSGNITAPWAVDNSSLEISANTLQIKDLGVTTAKLNVQAVTQDKIAVRTLDATTVPAGGIGISAGLTSQTIGSSTFTVLTGCTMTITTLGNPVFIGLVSNSLGDATGYIAPHGQGQGNVGFFRDGTQKSNVYCNNVETFVPSLQHYPASAFWFMDTPPAGTYTYDCRVQNRNQNVEVSQVALIVYELK